MRKTVFKCAESLEHVKEANIQLNDVIDVVNFCEDFFVPCSWTKLSVEKELGDGKDIALNHDVAHMIVEEIVTAWKNGHEALQDEMFKKSMPEMEAKQKACKEGRL